MPAEDVADGHFASHASLGYTCHLEGKECEWASCSMYLPSIARDKLVALTKFKRLRNHKKVALVAVDEAAGIAKVSTTKHVDLWMYAGFNPAEAVEEVIDLDDYEPKIS